MLRIIPIEAGQASKELQRILDASNIGIQEATNFLKVVANSAAALNAYLETRQALLKGQIAPRCREQIALAVAEINASDYCLAAHSLVAKKAGMTDEDIRLARRSAAADPKADAMLRFTQQIVLQRGTISDEDFCALGRAGFSKSELVEIIANIALNIFTNYLSLVAKMEFNFSPSEMGSKVLGDARQCGSGLNQPNKDGITPHGAEFLIKNLGTTRQRVTEGLPSDQTAEAYIKDHPFFKGMSQHHHRILSDCARPAHFDTGEMIFCEGDPAERFYLIQKGVVALETYCKGRGIVPIKTVGSGDMLGWSWLFPPCFWHLNARAAEPTDVIFIDGALLREECESDHELGYELLKRLSAVMLEQLQASRKPSLEAPDIPQENAPTNEQSDKDIGELAVVNRNRIHIYDAALANHSSQQANSNEGALKI